MHPLHLAATATSNHGHTFTTGIVSTSELEEARVGGLLTTRPRGKPGDEAMVSLACCPPITLCCEFLHPCECHEV